VLTGLLTPQLEVLEIHNKKWAAFLRVDRPLPIVFPETCPRLRKYVLRLPNVGIRTHISRLREFLIRTPTIKHLELCVLLPSDTSPLPSSALPNLRVYDATLSPPTMSIISPRKLDTLHIRDDFTQSYDLDSVHIPHEVSELHLTLNQHNAALLPDWLDRDLPNIESLYLDMRASQSHLRLWGDPKFAAKYTTLDSILIAVSESVRRVKAAYPIQGDDTDYSRRPGLHRLKKIDVDIDVGSIGTTPHAFEEWFRYVVAENCPVLKEAYFRVWMVNDRRVRENQTGVGPRFWARWRMGIDDHWCYEWGYTLGHESP
jgi:hypothetical protein